MGTPVKFTDLPSATALGGTEIVAGKQGTSGSYGGNAKILISQIGTYVRSLFTTTPATIAEGGTGAATANAALTNLTATRSETGAVAVPALTKFMEGPSLFDFIPVNLHAGIIARTNTTDLSSYIQAAVTALATGEKILCYPGTYRMESTVTVPGLVTLVAAGAGRLLQPTVTAPVLFNWYGGASIMFDFGAGVTTKAGGGLNGLRLDGRAIATRCLRVKDLQHGRFDDLVLTGAITYALELTNTDGLDPTMENEFNNLQISLRGGTTDSATGIYINGVGTGVSGVTLNKFRAPRIEHANGHGLLFELRGDGNLFENFYAYRAPTTETGYGIKFNSTDSAAALGNNIFLGTTNAIGGIYTELPSASVVPYPTLGTMFWSVNTTDLASDISDRFNPFVGPGRDLICGFNEKGMPLSMARIQNAFVTRFYDAMAFQSFDGTGLFQYNRDAIWKVVRAGAGGVIASSANPGGAITITTDATSGNDMAIYACADFTSGITYASDPIIQFNATPSGTITTMRSQFGLFGDSTLPDPTNGVYVQYDPAVHANFQLISRKAGTPTTITTSIAGASAKRYWMIALDQSQSTLFWTRLPTETSWTYLGVNATNGPTVVLTPGFRVETNGNVNRAIDVYSCEFSHITE